MATLDSALYTLQAQTVRGFGSRASAANVSAIPGYLTATYTATGTEAAGDVIRIGIVPEGCVVMPDLCRVSSDGVGGTTATVAKLGDLLDDDRYSATAIGITAAGSTAVTPTNAQAVTPTAVPLGGEIITATLGLAAGAFTAGKKVTFRIVYRSTV